MYLITNKNVFYDKGQFTQICTFFSDAEEYIELPPPAVLKVRFSDGTYRTDFENASDHQIRIFVGCVIQKIRCFSRFSELHYCRRNVPT